MQSGHLAAGWCLCIGWKSLQSWRQCEWANSLAGYNCQRDKVIHSYFEINWEIVCSIVKDDRHFWNRNSLFFSKRWIMFLFHLLSLMRLYQYAPVFYRNRGHGGISPNQRSTSKASKPTPSEITTTLHRTQSKGEAVPEFFEFFLR